MTDHRDAMKAAAEALETAQSWQEYADEEEREQVRAALSLLRAALEAREEPVDDSIIERLSDEADLCRQDGATDIANLLDEAGTYIARQAVELFRLAASPVAAPVEARPVAWLVTFPNEPELGHYLTEERPDSSLGVTPLYASPVAADTQGDALGYATRLAESLWRKHYQHDVPEWKPLPDLLGVLTQIDNIAAGLIRPRNADAIRAAMKEQPSDGVSASKECRHCAAFFSRFSCAAQTHLECDCPRCQGFCECNSGVAVPLKDNGNG